MRVLLIEASDPESKLTKVFRNYRSWRASKGKSTPNRQARIRAVMSAVKARRMAKKYRKNENAIARLLRARSAARE